ncbi:sodium/myo-inositol cotransporter 2-like, partial [Pollicipes pollicipes]|uniref:sodium/myo-inositol cotransporter 2-like n=1 Tax=Pollicipes pollicipes TaxID=41117 RepID=UPI0018855152
ALAARSLVHAKAGTVLAALLKMLPLWLMVFPGMAARVLYKDRVACSDPEACWRLCRSRSGCSNLAYIELVVQLLPPGLSGMMLAVMLAALMSSLTSIFNSASTLFSIDIYKRIRTNATEIEQVIVGRMFVIVMVGISIVWVPIINNFSSDQLFVYIQSMQSYLPPPICAVYVLSVFWSRTTEPGAFYGLVLGLAIGA